jgi:hypothetical protein
MKHLSSLEIERLNYINRTMDDIHDSSNQIYEHLVDREYDELKVEINNQIKQLKQLLDSLEDDI